MLTVASASLTGGWKTARFVLEWPVWAASGRPRPLIMGILNVTPDSFSDGGRFDTVHAALAHARQLLDEGADILDIGAESTRPGASPVDAEQEWLRLSPVLAELVKWNVPLSLDTLKPEVMARGIAIGVDVLNDVSGFRQPDACRVLASSGAGGIIMHMQGEPRSMQQSPVYDNCVDEVRGFLDLQVTRLQQAGVERNRLLVDPGFGFGKTLDHNLALFRALPAFASLANGVLVGVSRKSMIGQITGQSDPVQRVAGSVAAAVEAARLNARVLRVHDVRATVDALRVADALLPAEPLSLTGQPG